MFGQADRPIVPGPVSGQCLSQIRIRQKRIGFFTTEIKRPISSRLASATKICPLTRIHGSVTGVAANLACAALPILDERAGLLS